MTEWETGLITIVKTISQILTAGVAITAFSLLFYSLTFNLKDRVARSFSLIMFCLVIIFSTESFGATTTSENMVDMWLRFQWVGIILLPASYLNFSDALLETTGLPSRWRRKWAIRVSYLISLVFILLLTTPWFLGTLVMDEPPAPHNQPTLMTEIFTLYYIFILVISWVNFYRAFRRTVTKTSKRRMMYLTVSGLAPAIGSFPFLLYGSNFAASQTLLFWLIAATANAGLIGFVVIMAYSVAFFGVPWPDRVVKSRLCKWLLRGTVTACVTLAVVTIVRRAGQLFGNPYSPFVPIIMVVTILVCEYGITMFYPYLEKWLFFTKDEDDFLLARSLEDRIITRSDLKQFIEMILAAVCDRLQVSGAYLLEITEGELGLITYTGEKHITSDHIDEIETIIGFDVDEESICWNNDILIPIKMSNNGNPEKTLGFLGINGLSEKMPLDDDAAEALKVLTSRTAIVLRDHSIQEQLFQSIEKLNSQEELIQQLRAVGRYNRKGVLQEDITLQQNELTQAVKDALTHYWGGPKLTENPLLNFAVVKQALDDYDQNPANALRSVLKTAIEQTKPDGERKYTGEWLLYNILDLKFLEGKKVREIALKLSLSEADLYRKQRVAIEVVADTIVQMEMKLTDSQHK